MFFRGKDSPSYLLKSNGRSGDYDGDKVTILWDPALVQPFRNFTGAYEPPKPEFFGIRKDDLRVKAVYGDQDFARKFIKRGLDFNMQQPMVGVVTNYLEGYAYQLRCAGDLRPLSNIHNLRLATLVGYLVDAGKNGYIFGEEEWRTYKDRQGLPKSVQRPAYKLGVAPSKNAQAHPIDYLVFYVAVTHIDAELTDFSKRFGLEATASWFDGDLTTIWNGEEKFAELYEPSLKATLADLKTQVSALIEKWKRGSDRNRLEQDSENKAFRLLVEELRHNFLAIRPFHGSNSPSTRRWKCDIAGEMLSSSGDWDLLKASCLYARTYNSTHKLPWWVCARELVQIKAMKRPGARLMISSMYDIYKVDKAAVRRREDRDPLHLADDGDAEEEDGDEMDSSVFMDAVEQQ